MSLVADNVHPWLPTRQSLLDRLRKESADEDWVIFFNTYWRLLYATASKRGLKPSECEDVVQETILSVVKQMPNFVYDPKKGQFKSWLYNLLIWKIRDYFRARQRRDKVFSDDEVELVPEPVGESSEESSFAAWEADWETNLREAAFDALRKKVEPSYFQIFQLADVEGWTGKEIAEFVGVNRAVVYTARYRVKKMLTRLISEMRRNPEKFLLKYENKT